MEKRGRGQPRKFSRELFEQYVFEYFEYIYNSQTKGKADVPTFYGFYMFVNEKVPCDYRTIRRCFDEYCPDIKKEFEEIRANLLVRGTSLGKYQPTIVIFALKNWCSWSDRPNETTVIIDDTTRNEVVTLVDNIRKQNNKG
jgi:hypothetical protein